MPKDFNDLVCPNCGRKRPIFVCDCCRVEAYPTHYSRNKDKFRYSFSLEIDDRNNTEDRINDAIREGTAICKCYYCGTEINYFEEDKDNA